jgi:hypothetical protein
VGWCAGPLADWALVHSGLEVVDRSMHWMGCGEPGRRLCDPGGCGARFGGEPTVAGRDAPGGRRGKIVKCCESKYGGGKWVCVEEAKGNCVSSNITFRLV